MKKINTVSIIFTSLAFVAMSCTGSSGPNLNPEPTRSTIKAVPDFYTDPDKYTPEGMIGARASETSRDMMIADEKAQNAARGSLRLQVKDIGETGNTRFVKETGLDAESQIVKRFEGGNESASSSALEASRVIHNETQKDGVVYRAYVLMVIPDPALETLRQLEQDKELMAKFEQTDYFNDLSKRLARYRDLHGK